MFGGKQSEQLKTVSGDKFIAETPAYLYGVANKTSFQQDHKDILYFRYFCAMRQSEVTKIS